MSGEVVCSIPNAQKVSGTQLKAAAERHEWKQSVPKSVTSWDICPYDLPQVCQCSSLSYVHAVSCTAA